MQINPSANLPGLMKIIPASKFQLTPLFEAVTNSIESLAAISDETEKKIEINLYFNDQDKNHLLLEKINIHDNGAGFTSEAFSRFKEILDSSKGYNNRGTGRLQYLHRFEEVSVDSNYFENNEWLNRRFKCNKQNFIYGNEIPKPSKVNNHYTNISMYGFCPQKGDEEFFNKLTFEKFASLIRAQFTLRAYLEREKGHLMPTLVLKFNYQIEESIPEITIQPDGFPKPYSKGSFDVNYVIPRLGKQSKIQWNKDTAIPPSFLNGLFLNSMKMILKLMVLFYVVKIFLLKRLRTLYYVKRQVIKVRKSLLFSMVIIWIDLRMLVTLLTHLRFRIGIA